MQHGARLIHKGRSKSKMLRYLHDMNGRIVESACVFFCLLVNILPILIPSILVASSLKCVYNMHLWNTKCYLLERALVLFSELDEYNLSTSFLWYVVQTTESFRILQAKKNREKKCITCKNIEYHSHNLRTTYNFQSVGLS